MPKTRHIIMGFYKALPGILNVVFLMVFLFFISSVLSVYLFQNDAVPAFASLSAAMHTLFQVLTGDEWHQVMVGVQGTYPKAWLFFYTYYILMVFLVLNLFIGVVVGALQSAEAEVYESGEENQLVARLDQIHAEIMALKKSIQK
jgi:voltage-gated sodium channel